jgi:UDP-N-acetylmuramyl pentapeptide phosphotransferase/UDP-N-acetylglucosamine-1-phosphate transferase
MLGDTGANALGGALGVGVVLTASDLALAIVLAALAAANVLSELVSFSRIIDAVPPLRALDRAGRRD